MIAYNRLFGFLTAAISCVFFVHPLIPHALTLQSFIACLFLDIRNESVDSYLPNIYRYHT